MNLQIALSVALCLIGAVVYVVSSNGKASELARLAYFAGLLVALLFGGGVISIR